MNDLIDDWKQNFGRRQDSIFDFLRWLKFHKSDDRVDRVAAESHELVQLARAKVTI